MLKKLLLLMILAVIAVGIQAKKLHSKSYYQERWCQVHQGRLEVKLTDNPRVDCMTTTHAVRFDFGKNWTEAIGVGLHYALQSGKKAGVALILEYEEDESYWTLLNDTIRHYKLPIKVWKIEP